MTKRQSFLSGHQGKRTKMLLEKPVLVFDTDPPDCIMRAGFHKPHYWRGRFHKLL